MRGQVKPGGDGDGGGGTPSAGGRLPIYRGRTTRYEVDSCRPQIQAIRAGKIDFHGAGRGGYPGRRLGARQLAGVPTIGFWDAVGPQDWGLEPHRNEGVEISLLETGHMDFQVDAKRFRLQPGSLTITRPWQLHRLGLPHIGPGRFHWVVIDVGVRRPSQEWVWPEWIVLTPADCRELTLRLRQNHTPVFAGSRRVRDAFQRIARALPAPDLAGHLSEITVSLNELLLGVLALLRSDRRGLDPHLASRRHTVELFLEDLRTNPAALGRDRNVREMAAECGMGVTSFSRLCREVVNTSPMEYLQRCRLAAAADLLVRCPDRAVTDIAMQCGFNSSQYFAACFRRRYGRTPSAHRAGRPRPW